jgi:carboxyl-terminal processing protease
MKLRLLALSLLSSSALLCAASAVMAAPEEESGSNPSSLTSRTYEYLNLFGDVFERVRTDYVEEVDDGELIENAINGMLTALDPHSSYLNEKSFMEMQVQTKGEFGGLGIEVTMDNGLVKVVSPIDDTPAYRAGVKAGDYISHIDNQPVMGLTLSEAVEKMRGKVGSDITITILREGLSEPLDLTLTRDVIKIQSIRSRKEGDIGYLRITSFSEQTFDKMKESLTQLQKEIPDMKGLVLDLRNNPGGLLDQAIAVSDGFLEHGEIVSTRGRRKDDIHRYSATEGDLLNGLPIVVLINAGSASASEIVAGALQDHQRAVIMGNKSFGKGSVQTVIPLPSHGAMRLTTSRYYTPSGTSIQAKGIEPDIEVQQAKIELVGSDKYRVYEANLKGALENGNAGEKNSLQTLVGKDKLMRDEELKNKRGAAVKAKSDTEESKEQAKDDFQLARALDLLRGIAVYKKTSIPKSKGAVIPAPATPAAPPVVGTPKPVMPKGK